MPRCTFLAKGVFPGQDGKMHTYCYCQNAKSKNNHKYSMDTCKVCADCLDHTKKQCSPSDIETTQKYSIIMID